LKITTICAIHDDINSYLKWINLLDTFALDKNISFQHLLISSKDKLANENSSIKFFLVDEKSFWARSIKFGLDKIQKECDMDYILIFNHDSIPSLEGVKEALELIEMNDLVSGTISNKASNENVFGLNKEISFLKFKVLNDNECIDKAVCAHGNFLLFSYESYREIKFLPNFSHTFLDFYISSWFIKNKKKVSRTFHPVGFTNESLQFRREKLKSDTGIFKPGRSNIKDVYAFYKFYKNFLTAFTLVIYHFFKELFFRLKNL